MNTNRLLAYWLARTPPTAWMSEAACRNRTDLPWTQDGDSLPRLKGVAARMRTVCDGCPVRPTCEDFVIQADVTGGFWAGRWRSLGQVRARHARSGDAEAA